MSEHMRKRHINQGNDVVRMHHGGVIYQFPLKVAEKYRIKKGQAVSPDEVFASVNKQYTKPGALLRGLRVRENLTQVEMAKRIKVTQSDISQMENGTRSIGRKVAQRIEALFEVDYREFLE